MATSTDGMRDNLTLSEADLAACDEVTLDVWCSRPILEKLVGPVCWILERQQ